MISHSRGAAPCVKTGQPATPIARELPASYRPYAVLFIQIVSTIAELDHSPNVNSNHRLSRCIATIRSSARSLLPTFRPVGPPSVGCLNFEIPLPNIVYLNSIRYNRSARKRGNPGFVILGHLTAKRVINSLKANLLSLLQHEGDIITDRDELIHHCRSLEPYFC